MTEAGVVEDAQYRDKTNNNHLLLRGIIYVREDSDSSATSLFRHHRST